ncbi:outer membrane beta-barrel family protein [Pedobacter steynii]|uniref:Outer membrane protein beta-barrel domain-containing protein n=1 Tax=Pedobacter steynii TaxID=430522 RepID=A0A1D7QNF9_9SPHI|nr:outer membrane beta-barrel family protein [Pedobacter steynii]AOM80169.1 hypothetical protein BFS30_25210 [Pedobacter steynii]
MRIVKLITGTMLLLIVLTVQTSALFAQNAPGEYQIKGVTADSASRSDLPFTTVRIKDEKGLVLKAVASDKDGKFVIPALGPLNYQISFAALGYYPKTISLNLSGKELKEIDLGAIYLTEQSKTLKNVVITGERPMISQKADRIVYDLKADPESKVSSVLDMAPKIPYLTLDGQNNILLKGNSSFKVLINGRPSASVEGNLTAILKSMPASTIEKIEVITIPPSKYDGEGLAGIINIIVSKKISDGYNGSFNLNESFPAGGPGFGGSITAKSGNFAISAFGGASLNDNPETSYEGSRLSYGTVMSNLFQKGLQKSDQKTGYFGTELSYSIDSLNLVSGQFNLNGGRSSGSKSQSSALIRGTDPLQGYDLLNHNKGKNYGFDAAVNYQISFKKAKDQLLTFSYQYSNSGTDRNGDIDLSNLINYDQSDYRQNDHQKFNENTFQMDFTTTVKKINIEAGLKGILRSSSSNFDYNSFNADNGQFEFDPEFSNRYTNTQNVFSAYNSYRIALKSWNIIAGVRVEQTVIRGDFISNATVANQNYFNVLPSIAINKNFKDQSSLGFGFSQRIRRPSIKRLNPYVDRSNPLFETSGNPNLRPVLLNDIQVNYGNNKKLSINAGLNYSFMNNLDLQVVNFDPATQITRTTYDNTGKSSSLGGNLSISYPISKAYRVGLNGNAMYLWLEGNSDGIIVNNDLLMYSLSFSNSFNLNKGWRLNATLNGVSKSPTGLQGTTKGYISTSFSVSKQLIADKLSLGARINNPFVKYRNNDSSSFGKEFNQYYTSRDYFQNFTFNLNYNFGRLKGGVNKTRRNITNNDIAN